MSRERWIRWVIKPIVFLAALVPFFLLVSRAYRGELGADPLVKITNDTGLWTLRFLVITLSLTPLRRMTHWNALTRFRRMLGLFAFFYGFQHFLIYLVADRFASLDFPDGFVAWSTARNLLISIWRTWRSGHSSPPGSSRSFRWCRWP